LHLQFQSINTIGYLVNLATYFSVQVHLSIWFVRFRFIILCLYVNIFNDTLYLPQISIRSNTRTTRKL